MRPAVNFGDDGTEEPSPLADVERAPSSRKVKLAEAVYPETVGGFAFDWTTHRRRAADTATVTLHSWAADYDSFNGNGKVNALTAVGG